MSQDKPFVWKSQWEQLGWACNLGGAGLKITRVVQTVLTTLMENQIWHLPESAGWVGGGLNKGIMASASSSVWEKTAPPALI